MPIGWNNIMIHYNRSTSKCRHRVPYAGWTWDHFREVAKKLTNREAAGTVTQWGYEVPNQNFFIQPWLFSNGTRCLNDDWSASNMLDPKVAETLQFLHDIIHVDGVADPWHRHDGQPVPRRPGGDDHRGHWVIEKAKSVNLDMDVAVAEQGERHDRHRLRQRMRSRRRRNTPNSLKRC